MDDNQVILWSKATDETMGLVANPEFARINTSVAWIKSFFEDSFL